MTEKAKLVEEGIEELFEENPSWDLYLSPDRYVPDEETQKEELHFSAHRTDNSNASIEFDVAVWQKRLGVGFRVEVGKAETGRLGFSGEQQIDDALDFIRETVESRMQSVA